MANGPTFGGPRAAGNNLRSLRMEYGMTQTEWAFVCSVHPQTVSDWERSKVRPSKAAGRLLQRLEEVYKAPARRWREETAPRLRRLVTDGHKGLEWQRPALRWQDFWEELFKLDIRRSVLRWA